MSWNEHSGTFYWQFVADAGLGQKKRAVATGIEAFDGPILDLALR